MTADRTSRLGLELPAALLHVGPRLRSGLWEELTERLTGRLAASGVHRLRPDVIAVVPIAGDPAIHDTAASLGRLLAAAAADEASGRTAEASLLVAPATVTLTPSGLAARPEPLLTDLAEHPLELPANRVHLTARAALSLEAPHRLTPAGVYRRPAGREVPLYTAEPAAAAERPWRNREILGRASRAVKRPELARTLGRAVEVGAVRLEGPLGVGKTRLALEALTGSGTLIYAAAPPGRSAEPGLALQVVARWLSIAGDSAKALEEAESRGLATARHRLLGTGAAPSPVEAATFTSLLMRAAERLATAGTGPLVVICDDLQNATEDDFAMLAALIERARPEVLRAVLVARAGARWPEALSALPSIEVPPLDDARAEMLADHLIGGLSTPPELRRRFLAAAGGNPFCFEEGLVALMRQQQLRKSYGNFFFAGDEATGFAPSPRLIQHAVAEGARLGQLAALRLLALADGALPVAEVRSAMEVSGASGEGAGGETGANGDWEHPFLAGGLLVETASPWGPGVTFRFPALGAALKATFPDGSAAEARRLLGELLVAHASDTAARWACYRLLAGTAEAATLILRLARDPRRAGALSGGELLDALTAELAAHRDRGGGASEELALGRARIETALRLSRLEGLDEEIERAVALADDVDERERTATARLAAEVARRTGRPQDAEKILRAALDTPAGGEADKAAVLTDLGRLLAQQGHHEEAAKLIGGLLASVDPERQELVASCHFHLGNIALARGRFDEALSEHAEALFQRRAIGQPRPLAASLTALGAVHLARGRYSKALDAYRQADEVAHQLEDATELAYVLLGEGRALRRLGDYAAASGPLRQALALREGTGDLLGEAMARLEVAWNYLDLELPREALRSGREAHFQLSLLGSEAPMGDAERLLGSILLSRRRYSVAHGHLGRALELHLERGDPVSAAFDRASLLDEAVGSHRPEEAVIQCRALAEFLETADYPERGERLDLRLYRTLAWLAERGERLGDPLFHLRRAYRALLAKAGHLDPDLRQRFLSQIPDHQAILVAATKHGLS